MLKEFGVKGVKVQEVFGLDDDMLAMLPYGFFSFSVDDIYPFLSSNIKQSKPVYGLIFLFQYRDVEDDEKQETSCPKHVWFANQVYSMEHFLLICGWTCEELWLMASEDFRKCLCNGRSVEHSKQRPWTGLGRSSAELQRLY